MHSELAVRRLALRGAGVCITVPVGGSGKAYSGIDVGIALDGDLAEVLVEVFPFGGTMDDKWWW